MLSKLLSYFLILFFLEFLTSSKGFLSSSREKMLLEKLLLLFAPPILAKLVSKTLSEKK